MISVETLWSEGKIAALPAGLCHNCCSASNCGRICALLIMRWVTCSLYCRWNRHFFFFFSAAHPAATLCGDRLIESRGCNRGSGLVTVQKTAVLCQDARNAAAADYLLIKPNKCVFSVGWVSKTDCNIWLRTASLGLETVNSTQQIQSMRKHCFWSRWTYTL